MPRSQVLLMGHIMCWACVLALIVSGTGSATAGPRVAMPDLEKHAATFLRRLGFALQGEVVCAAVSIGTQAYVCQALGIPQSPEANLQRAQLLAFYCSPEGGLLVCARAGALSTASADLPCPGRHVAMHMLFQIDRA